MQFRLREILITILLVVLVFGLVHVTLQSYEVRGASMESNFFQGQRILVEKVTYRFHSPGRGDIIVFWPPIHSTDPYIKRIIGLPGDKVVIEEGKIYIDGKQLKEAPDFPRLTFDDNCSITVPADRYFVLGDNRDDSYDSPNWGSDPEDKTVAREDIIGRVWIRYWPLGDLGFSPSYSYTF